ncbi:MAG: Smr/MutS family protein [Candidatus Rokubacteria bacterium]|nr:Smr/MutS family protein [Candidatus Rokubacteria bacterium]
MKARRRGGPAGRPSREVGRRVSVPVGRLVAIHRAGSGGEVREPLRLEPGLLCETLTVGGELLETLCPGTRLRVGAAAVVELGADAAGGGPGIVTASTGGGSLARVVEGGVVRVGDAVVIEAVPVPIEDTLDLHPFRPDQIADVVGEYLARAHAAGFAEVRLIHGRGQGVQRATVRRVLARSPLVAALADAPPERGGWGATIARLRPASERRPR